MEIWKPAWLEALDTQRFFAGCSAHEAAKKNEKNICCLDCCTSICPHCVPAHRFHRLLQVRRYVYHDVVRLEDLERLIDCSYVQSYTINSSKVVFIKKRPQNRQFKGSGNSCSSCDRTLQEPYIHCSLGCKVDFLLSQNKDISQYLRACDSLKLGADLVLPHLAGDDEDDDGTETTTQSTVVDNPSDSENRSSPPPITAEFVRRKRSGLHACCASTAGAAASMNRRKGTPHRSPSC